MTLRPDEIASLSEIERARKTDESLKKGLKTAANIGTTIAGAGLSAKLLPFLNELIPVDLAMKGISKLNPTIGNFLKQGMKQGLDLKDGLNFLKENLVQNKQTAPPKENRSVIQQYSPELHSFIEGEIAKGRSLLEAGALAQLHDKFKNIIRKMEADHKTPWSNILATVFGSQQPQANTQPQQPQPMQQEPQQNQGNADAAIMAALQKVLQM